MELKEDEIAFSVSSELAIKVLILADISEVTSLNPMH